VIESLTAEVVELRTRVAELERRLGQNSKNSSLPPSSDRFSGEGKRPARGAGRKPGKQPGGAGVGLEMSADPDEVVDHSPTACGGCGADLSDPAAGATNAGYARRQVHDLPQQIAAHVREHRLHRLRCGCGHTTTAAAPEGVAAAVQYGPRLVALVAYLVVVQHLPYERAVRLVADLYPGLRPSTGWACTAVAKTASALRPACQVIAGLLHAAAVVHADETSTSIAGQRWWLHVACTDRLTAFHLDPSRGRSAVTAFGILPGHTGVIVHDALSVYDAYTTAEHALCGAHLIRELVAAGEANPDQIWPDAALDTLSDLLTATHTARDAGQHVVPPEALDPLLHRWHHAIRVGLANHPRAPGKKQTPTRNLLQRLRDRADQVLLFARDLTVPFSNNQAERDLRPAKTQIKISGCHRSETGARNWLTIRGYTSTCRKNGIHILTALRDALTGKPWTPGYATA
jgi:transposase